MYDMLKIDEIPTDESLHSALEYGSPEFPMRYLQEDITDYKNYIIGWHWHSEVQFTYVLSGMVMIRAEKDEFILKEGDGYFLNSGTIHSFLAVDGGTLAHVVFSPNLLAPKSTLIYSKYVAPVLLSNVPGAFLDHNHPSSKPVCNQLSAIHKSMSQVQTPEDLDVFLQIQLLWSLFWKHEGAFLKPDGNAKVKMMTKTRLQKMMTFAQLHYTEKICLDDIAAAADISRSEALRCFKAGIQTTPVAYVSELRLKRAAQLLLSTVLSVNEISSIAGFEDAGYFCKAFRKWAGVSPGTFRKNNSQVN